MSSWTPSSPRCANSSRNASSSACPSRCRSPKIQVARTCPRISPPREVLKYLDKLTDPEQVADLVSCAVLAGPVERQTILETVNLESRLKHLIHFLMAEITRNRKDRHR